MNFKFNKSHKKFSLISISILMIAYLILFTGCDNNKTEIRNNHNKSMSEIIKEIREDECNSSFTEIIYASKDKVILCGAVGLIAYDINDEKIYRALDLKSIDMNYMQGSKYTIFSISDDSNKILMYNSSNEKLRYLYDIENDKLEKTNIEDLSDPYLNVGEIDTETYDKFSKKYTDADIQFDCTFYNIDKDNICYLIHPNKCKYYKKISPLQLVVLNKNTNTEKIYDIFK